MRLLLFVVVVGFNLHADYLLTVKSSSICIDDYYYQDGDLYYQQSFTQLTYKETREHVISTGYQFSNNRCERMTVLKETGLSYEHYSFLMAQSGLIIGILILLAMTIILPNVSRKD